MIQVKRMIGLALAAGTFLVFTPAFGADAGDAPTVKQPMGQEVGKMFVPDAEQRLKGLSTRLNLTEEQQARIKPILEEEFEQIKAIRDDTTLSIGERRAKFDTLRDAAAEKIKPLLTDEQRQKYEKLREQVKERRSKRPAPAPKQ